MSRIEEDIKKSITCIDEIKQLGDKLFDSVNDAFRMPINCKEQLCLKEELDSKFENFEGLLQSTKLGYGIEIDDENTIRELITQVKAGNRKERQRITNIKKNAISAGSKLKSKLRKVIKEDDLGRDEV